MRGTAEAGPTIDVARAQGTVPSAAAPERRATRRSTFADRTTARIVGALFIVATVTAIVGGGLVTTLDESTVIAELARNEGQVVSGAILELVLALSVVGIATLLFPVLRRRNEGLAMGYVGVRILEAVLLLTATMSALVLLSMGKDQVAADRVAVEPMGQVVVAARTWTYLVGSMVMLGAGALILYSLLLTSRLVPSWLAIWGLVGAALILLRGVLEMYGLDLPAWTQAVFAAPIALNEMVLAVRLIAKGFDEPDEPDAMIDLARTE